MLSVFSVLLISMCPFPFCGWVLLSSDHSNIISFFATNDKWHGTYHFHKKHQYYIRNNYSLQASVLSPSLYWKRWRRFYLLSILLQILPSVQMHFTDTHTVFIFILIVFTVLSSDFHTVWLFQPKRYALIAWHVQYVLVAGVQAA